MMKRIGLRVVLVAAIASVIDFINVGLGSVRTGIFNVADMAVLLGAAMIVMAGMKESASSPPL